MNNSYDSKDNDLKMYNLSDETKKWLFKKHICFFCNNEIPDDNDIYMGKGYAFCSMGCRRRMIKLLD